MSWKDLLQSSKDEEFIAPWIGGRSVHSYKQSWKITNRRLPAEHGWYQFKTSGPRKARYVHQEDRPVGELKHLVRGYLVGDFLVPDDVKVRPEISEIPKQFEKVYLVDLGVDRFARIIAGRFYDGGPLFFESEDMPLGPEEDVKNALFEEQENIDDIPDVVPALDAAFRVELWRRKEAERIRREEEERRRLEQERLEREQQRRELARRLGTGEGRREMARMDFSTAARAALTVGGARYLDHRQGVSRNEMVVRFSIDGRPFECTCDRDTMRIIDAGVCLTDERTGEKGDTRFTLESLPSVIQQAQNEGVLVIFRHVY